MDIISVVGESGSGKTKLIESLVQIFKAMGLRVGTLKHSGGDFAADVPGKDSHRFFEAGAHVSAVASDKKVSFSMRKNADFEPEEIFNKFEDLLDLLIVEGYSKKEFKKIFILKDGRADDIIARLSIDESTILFYVDAGASFSGWRDEKHVFVDINTPRKIAAFIALYLSLGKNTVFVGAGNPMKGDDGFGPEVIRKAKKKPGCLYIDAGMSPENYVSKISARNPDTLIVFDSIYISNGTPPGTLGIFSPEQLPNLNFSTHGFGIRLFLDYLQENVTAKIFVIGVQPEKMSLSGEMSKSVKATLNEILYFFERGS